MLFPVSHALVIITFAFTKNFNWSSNNSAIKIPQSKDMFRDCLCARKVVVLECYILIRKCTKYNLQYRDNNNNNNNFYLNFSVILYLDWKRCPRHYWVLSPSNFGQIIGYPLIRSCYLSSCLHERPYKYASATSCTGIPLLTQ